MHEKRNQNCWWRSSRYHCMHFNCRSLLYYCWCYTTTTDSSSTSLLSGIASTICLANNFTAHRTYTSYSVPPFWVSSLHVHTTLLTPLYYALTLLDSFLEINRSVVYFVILHSFKFVISYPSKSFSKPLMVRTFIPLHLNKVFWTWVRSSSTNRAVSR